MKYGLDTVFITVLLFLSPHHVLDVLKGEVTIIVCMYNGTIEVVPLCLNEY